MTVSEASSTSNTEPPHEMDTDIGTLHGVARRCEAADIADLGGDRVGEHPADPGTVSKSGT
jgi:hypothetical protein